jgi:hypothetical protein
VQHWQHGECSLTIQQPLDRNGPCGSRDSIGSRAGCKGINLDNQACNIWRHVSDMACCQQQWRVWQYWLLATLGCVRYLGSLVHISALLIVTHSPLKSVAAITTYAQARCQNVGGLTHEIVDTQVICIRSPSLINSFVKRPSNIHDKNHRTIVAACDWRQGNAGLERPCTVHVSCCATACQRHCVCLGHMLKQRARLC